MHTSNSVYQHVYVDTLYDIINDYQNKIIHYLDNANNIDSNNIVQLKYLIHEESIAIEIYNSYYYDTCKILQKVDVSSIQHLL